LSSGKQQFRLMRFLPVKDSDGDLEGPIRCQMRNFDFSETPPFTALSYAWGHTVRSCGAIFIDDATMNVISEGLYDALQHLRQHFRDGVWSATGTEWLWIDGICINQEDALEKTNQVQMMATIYAHATNVISWLGSGNPAAASAIDFMANTVQATRNAGHSKREHALLIGTEPILNEKAAAQDANGSEDIIVDPRLVHLFSLANDIPAFFSVQYWRRLWIVQEIVLTKPQANIVMYGDKTILFSDVQVFRDSWLEFLKRLQLLPRWEESLVNTPGWEDVAESWPAYIRSMEATMVVWSYYDFLRSVGGQGDNLFWIILSSAYYAVDGRDKVFGFMSLGSQPGQPQTQPSNHGLERLVPDYTKPVEEIYRKWFTLVLKDWGSLDPLYFAGTSSRTGWAKVERKLKGLPTWTPDLRCWIRESPVWDATLSKTMESASMGRSFQFDQEVRPHLPSFDGPQGSILHGKALLAGTAAFRAPVEGGRINLPSIYDAVVRQGVEQVTTLSIFKVVFHALMCGVDRFDASDIAKTIRLAGRELAPSEKELSVGSDQFQLVHSMPLIQAVAKFTMQRHQTALVTTQDRVIQALYKSSRQLGTNSVADTLLLLAFTRLFIAAMWPDELAAFSSQMDLRPGADVRAELLRVFTLQFTQSEDAELKDIDIEHLLANGTIPALQQTLSRYLEAYDHTLFVTTDGMIGNGPRELKVGDEIVVFDDVQMPFIVRPSVKDEGLYELIGTCYVQGISDGELAAAARRGELTPVDIALV
jgi:hypothetical protein